jgi:hypothetical protein
MDAASATRTIDGILPETWSGNGLAALAGFLHHAPFSRSGSVHASADRTTHCRRIRCTAPPSFCGGPASGRRRHGALYFPLPQGSHRRPGRHPAAQPAGTPRLPARAGRPPRRRDRQHRRTGQARRRRCAKAIENAETKQRLEDLYLPFKQKRRTKAQIAREAGIEPLADSPAGRPGPEVPETEAATYVNARRALPTPRRCSTAPARS